MAASAATNQPAQHLQGLYSRNLGHLRRAPSKSVTPVTPSDDLTSWLGDDLCAHCAKAVSSGQLYCSGDCRTADEKATAVAQADQLQSEAPSPLVGASHLYKAGSSTRGSASGPSGVSSPNFPFRYHCPPSPNLVAAQSRSSQALTSPALTAFQRSLPSYNRGARASPHVPSDTSEDSLGSTPARRPGSSHSTFSSDSTSDAAYTTDPSTNSPPVATTSGDENSDSEPSQLNLPPSLHSSVLLKHQRKSESRSTSATGPPSAPSSLLASSMSRRSSGPAVTSRPPQSTMRFARRPSSTNLPPPVLYSPILSPVHFKSGGQYSASSSAKASPSPPHGLPALSHPQSFDAAKATFVKMGRSAARELSTVDWAHRRASNGMAMARGSSDQTTDRSPPPLLSAASSAGKTLMALSPKRTTSIEFVCGRPGCDGSIARRSSMTSISSSSEARAPATAARRASSPKTWSKPAPPSHKHTHSATAGLGRDSLQRASSAIKGLTMTPSRKAVDLQEDTTIISRGRATRRGSQCTPDSISPCTGMQDGVTPPSPFIDANGDREDRSAPPRGRSHARGDRSSSRRARSPSRDRRRLQTSIERLAATDADALSPKSNPIKILDSKASPRSLEELAAATALKGASTQPLESPQRHDSISPLALRARKFSDSDGGQRRGRSPPVEERGRGRAGAPNKTYSPVDSMNSSRSSIGDAEPHSSSEDRGFDDVDLDLN